MNPFTRNRRIALRCSFSSGWSRCRPRGGAAPDVHHDFHGELRPPLRAAPPVRKEVRLQGRRGRRRNREGAEAGRGGRRGCRVRPRADPRGQVRGVRIRGQPPGRDVQRLRRRGAAGRSRGHREDERRPGGVPGDFVEREPVHLPRRRIGNPREGEGDLGVRRDRPPGRLVHRGGPGDGGGPDDGRPEAGIRARRPRHVHRVPQKNRSRRAPPGGPEPVEPVRDHRRQPEEARSCKIRPCAEAHRFRHGTGGALPHRGIQGGRRAALFRHWGKEEKN